MTVALDTSVLIYFLNENASSPIDPTTGKPVTLCKERVNKLIDRLSKDGDKAIIPTPVLAEVLVRAAASGPQYLSLIDRHRGLRLADFNALAAVEAAVMASTIFASPQRPVGGDARSKMKFDTMIAAIAKVNNCTVVYSDDPDISVLGKRFNFSVVGVGSLPLPDAETPDMFRVDT